MSSSANDRTPGRRTVLSLLLLLAAAAAWILFYSLDAAWVGDEGFHLLASQLIAAGKRPYLDFFYQHAPLWAYANAAWMKVFGPTWRSAHVFSALSTAGCTALVAEFVFSRLPEPDWKLAGAAAAALMMALSTLVLPFGVIGQPYGLCLLLVVLSFRLAAAAAARSGRALCFWAGSSAGAAAASLLLAAPAAVALFFWLRRSEEPRRPRLAAFAAGVVVPFLPLFWLASQGPRQVFFDVIQYHLFYRHQGFQNLARADIGQLSAWVHSTQGLMLALLAGIGTLFAASTSDRRLRRELGLCVWLIGGLGLLMAAAHPTFSHYFVLAAPFVTILAAMGIYAVGSRINVTLRPRTVILAVIGMFAVPLARMFPSQHHRPQRFWQAAEDIGNAINRLTPAGGPACAGEFFLFAAGRIPPSGLENRYSRDLRIPAALAARLHVVSGAEIDRWLAEGRCAAVAVWSEDPMIQTWGLPRAYSKVERVHDFAIFHEPRR
jgi:4-amino-4-deoxy-L-arabinose transferase-like glycosyltransferase